MSAATQEAFTDPINFSADNLPEFPSDTLPIVYREFVEHLAGSLQVPRDLPGILVLSVISSAVQKKFKVEARQGWQEPLNIYAAVALGVGERKTPAFKAAQRPVFEFEREQTKRIAAKMHDAEAAIKVAKARSKGLEKRIAKEDDEDARKTLERELASIVVPETPKTPRLIVDDITPERLGDLLGEHDGRISVFSDEGGIFDIIAGRYNSGVPNFDLFLKAHDGSPYRYDRKNQPAVIINEPAITIGMAVQPDVIRNLAAKPGFRGKGLLGRFMYAMPKGLVGSREIRPAAMPFTVAAEYATAIRELLDISERRDEDGDLVPTVLRLDADADRLLEEFEIETERRLKISGDLGESVQDWGAKLGGKTVRLAGLLEIAANGPRATSVSARSMRSAIRLSRYLVPHAIAAFGEMSADDTLRNAHHVMRWIREKNLSQVTRRQIQQGNKSRFGKENGAQLDGALKCLVGMGWLLSLPQPVSRSKGRPPEAYQVHRKTQETEF